jgi:predicted ATPase with chaperone activity
LDRISIELDVQKQTTLQAGSLSHTWYREKVLEIDERIRSRNGKRGNNSLNRAQLMEHLQGSAEHRLLEDLSRRFSLSPRGQIGTMQVARTLADWNGKDKIGEECLEEAFQYRSIRLLAMSVFSEAA